MEKKIKILTDYLGFMRRDNHQCSSLNLKKISEILERNGFHCKILSFQEIFSKETDITNNFIWYSSSEFSSYKNYIEDILLYLNNDNILIPDFDFFRAHNNKGYQALIREKYNIPELNSIYLGTLEELEYIIDNIEFPVVLKSVKGSSSKNVELIKNKVKLRKIVRRNSRCKNYCSNGVKKLLKRYLFKNRYDYENSLESLHYYNFVLQKFIPGLANDWKVLIFYDKFYTLKRETRRNDFRASGSGKFSYGDFNENVLDFCQDLSEKFNVPWLSLDVGFDGNRCYLFEYQMLHFGPMTMKNSSHYFKKDKESWNRVKKNSDLSKEYALAFVKHIRENYD